MKTWFHGYGFNSGTREGKLVDVGEYTNVPAEHHIHSCLTCGGKDYPCTEQHFRTTDDGKRFEITPPRATKQCPECRGF